jgi:hypothetical protein
MATPEPAEEIKRIPSLVEIFRHIRLYESPDLFDALVEDLNCHILTQSKLAPRSKLDGVDMELILDRWAITLKISERGKPAIRPFRGNLAEKLQRTVEEALETRPRAGDVVNRIAGLDELQQN